MSSVPNVFSNEDMEYLVNKATAIFIPVSSGIQYFTVPLTATIRSAIHLHLGLDLSSVSEIPMRWITGDTAAHTDSGASIFEHTYLVYLTDSPGEFILDNTAHPIRANTGFIFHEGLLHKTENTGFQSRLLLGPMNEFAEPVGTTIQYYNNYADAFAQNGNTIATQGITFVLGDTPNITGSIIPYTSWRVAYVYGSPAPTGVYNNGFDLFTLGLGSYTYYVYPSAPCFLEDSKILCLVNGEEIYLPIQSITVGTLVKTSLSGYKKVELIGKGEIQNPGNHERMENRLYKCSPQNYPELTEDLYITGCHSILVNNITELEREDTIKHLGRVYVTDRKYRLIACVDERAEPWNSEGCFTIWHLALENTDADMNYGVYANGGLLVETCSINRLKKKSNLSLV